MSRAQPEDIRGPARTTSAATRRTVLGKATLKRNARPVAPQISGDHGDDLSLHIGHWATSRRFLRGRGDPSFSASGLNAFDRRWDAPGVVVGAPSGGSAGASGGPPFLGALLCAAGVADRPPAGRSRGGRCGPPGWSGARHRCGTSGHGRGTRSHSSGSPTRAASEHICDRPRPKPGVAPGWADRCHTALGGNPPISRVNNAAGQYT